MIVGLGVDIVDVDRFERALARSPRLGPRLLTQAELEGKPASRAARFAAKEALAKVLGAPPGLRWHDCEVVGGGNTAPTFRLTGTVAAACEQRGITDLLLTLSHDGGMAVAVVVAQK